MLLAAARRFLLLLAAAVGVTALASLLVGALSGASAARALSIGFYMVGSFLLVAGFFVGNRGPARVKGEDRSGPFGFFGWRRGLRWATVEEREDAINTSAVFVMLGVVLLVLGIVADSRHDVV